MAKQTYIDKRVTVGGGTSKTNLQNALDLNAFIVDVMDDASSTVTQIDLNGNADALILDADGDTTISAPTDDQIDIQIGGSDDFRFTANRLKLLTGSAIIGANGTEYATFIPLSAQQDLSGAGAMSLLTYYTAWTTTSTDAGTLADGTVLGQMKKIQLVVDGGDGTLTPSNLSGGTTITFADAGDFALLQWNGANWLATELGNAADGVSAPVLA